MALHVFEKPDGTRYVKQFFTEEKVQEYSKQNPDDKRIK